MQWRKRTKGSPNQVGKPFPVETESQTARKNALPKIRAGFVRLVAPQKKIYTVVYDDGSERGTEFQVEATSLSGVFSTLKSNRLDKEKVKEIFAENSEPQPENDAGN